MTASIETLGQGAVALLIFSFFLVLGILGFLLWYGWFVSKTRGALCPYTKGPLFLGVDIAPSIRKYVDSFLLSHSQPENEPFDFSKAAICEKTGRIFPNCVARGERIHLDWTFLQKRHPGSFVSWGSLSEMEQWQVRSCHESMQGFQCESSATMPLPKEIDPYHANKKPGPLYVDKQTKVLLGWKEVPGTRFEVLIVQKPLYDYIEDFI
jgi:hypothetical protein